MLICSQLAQDDDGNFEIASFGGSLDEETEDSSQQPASHSYTPVDGQLNTTGGYSRTPPGRPERHSLDGETIFAIGEDGDKLSDEEA